MKSLNMQLRRYYEKEGKIHNHQEFLFFKAPNIFLKHEQRRRLIETLKIVPKSKTLLDVGCGEGLMTYLFEANFTVGVDISSNKIKRSRKNKNICFIVADAHHLPFKSKFFETSISAETLEHLSAPEMALKEIKRVTTNFILLSIPMTPFIEKILLKMKDNSLGFDEIGKGHLRTYDKKSLQKELESLENFRIEKVMGGCFGIHTLLRVAFGDLISDKLYPKICTMFDKLLSKLFPFRSKHLILFLKLLKS